MRRSGKSVCCKSPKSGPEGFTLPKILWVKKNEPKIYRKAKTFVLPKDYVRDPLTGKLHMEYSDAGGTLLLDINKKEWSKAICRLLGYRLTGSARRFWDLTEEVGYYDPGNFQSHRPVHLDARFRRGG